MSKSITETKSDIYLSIEDLAEMNEDITDEVLVELAGDWAVSHGCNHEWKIKDAEYMDCAKCGSYIHLS